MNAHRQPDRGVSTSRFDADGPCGWESRDPDNPPPKPSDFNTVEDYYAAWEAWYLTNLEASQRG